MNRPEVIQQSAASPIRQYLSDLTIVAAVCLVVLLSLLVIAIAGPWLAPYGEGEILSNDSFALADSTFALGGDFLGRDILSRLIYAVRVTLGLAFVIATLSFLIGCSLGFIAAVRRGWFDTFCSRIVDTLISFPAIMIALIVISGLGSSYTVLVVTISLIDSTRVYRVARALGMDIAVQDYVEAARVRGERLGWIMWQEVLPNALAPLAAEFGIRFTYAILFISALSFLGLGVQPPHADLGVMVKENMQGLLYGSYAPLYPALVIAMVTVSVNLLVDWYLKINDAALPDEIQS